MIEAVNELEEESVLAPITQSGNVLSMESIESFEIGESQPDGGIAESPVESDQVVDFLYV